MYINIYKKDLIEIEYGSGRGCFINAALIFLCVAHIFYAIFMCAHTSRIRNVCKSIYMYIYLFYIYLIKYIYEKNYLNMQI